jgi:hypothetical protein
MQYKSESQVRNQMVIRVTQEPTSVQQSWRIRQNRTWLLTTTQRNCFARAVTRLAARGGDHIAARHQGDSVDSRGIKGWRLQNLDRGVSDVTHILPGAFSLQNPTRHVVYLAPITRAVRAYLSLSFVSGKTRFTFGLSESKVCPQLRD